MLRNKASTTATGYDKNAGIKHETNGREQDIIHIIAARKPEKSPTI
jgi:hypothetical protein